MSRHFPYDLIRAYVLLPRPKDSQNFLSYRWPVLLSRLGESLRMVVDDNDHIQGLVRESPQRLHWRRKLLELNTLQDRRLCAPESGKDDEKREKNDNVLCFHRVPPFSCMSEIYFLLYSFFVLRFRKEAMGIVDMFCYHRSMLSSAVKAIVIIALLALAGFFEFQYLHNGSIDEYQSYESYLSLVEKQAETSTSSPIFPSAVSTSTASTTIVKPVIKQIMKQTAIPVVSLPPVVAPSSALPIVLPPKVISSDEVYAEYHPAVLNIWCEGDTAVTTGTATIIDPSGILITNAHVVKDVKDASRCVLRSWNPFENIAKFKILYIPPQDDLIPGTSFAKNDFAFIKITEPILNKSQTVWPFIHFNTAIPSPKENLFVFGYSTEFVGFDIAIRGIPLLFSDTEVEQVLSFDDDLKRAELLLVKGSISSQGGSSGGPLVNNAKDFVAMYSFVTKGSTTSERRGIAVLVNYVDRALNRDFGFGLKEFLQKTAVSTSTQN